VKLIKQLIHVIASTPGCSEKGAWLADEVLMYATTNI
jgi:hypothetical protein